MRWLIVLLILTMFLAGGVPAQQDDELIFPCLGDPASLILVRTYGKRIDGTTFEVWFFDSRDTDDWYLLMLDDTQTDYHCGCGAWRVDELTMTDWLHPILYRWF